MSTASAPPTENRTLNTENFLLYPPTPRDCEIYQGVHIEGVSTREMAGRKKMSQTRVRQIVKRVVQWLALTLPPQSDLEDEKEIRLSQKITADRLLFVYQEIMALWRSTHHSKYLSQTIRVSMAQARLGVLPGLTENLLADAESGDLAPVGCVERSATHQPEASARDTSDDDVDEPVGWDQRPQVAPAHQADSFPSPEPQAPSPEIPTSVLHQLNQIRNVLSVQQEVDMAAELLAAEVFLTPEQRAQAEQRRQGIPARLRAAGLHHLLPVFDEFLSTLPTAPDSQPSTFDVRPSTSHSPPSRACSPNPATVGATDATSPDLNASTADTSTAYDANNDLPNPEPRVPSPLHPPLLTPATNSATLHLQISPDQPGAIAQPTTRAPQREQITTPH